MLQVCQLLSDIIQQNYSNSYRKLISLPLEFDNLAVDILAKQFTKLKSTHSYRIHYLGPRFANTQSLHRKYASIQDSQACLGLTDRFVKPYKLNWKKLPTSYRVNEQLRTNNYYKATIYYRAFEGMNPTLNLDQEFVFNSVFESGNLDCVIQYKPYQFDCFLRIDSNTRGHLQWFYFSVKNGKSKQKIKLNICNISKSGVLYSQGQTPFIFSAKLHQASSIGWIQGSKNLTNLKFEKKAYNYEIISKRVKQKPNCLSFQYSFEFEEDQVFFAYCIPYTYSQMLYDIQQLPKQYCQIHTLAKSFTGIDVPILSIIERSEKYEEKKNIFITGRIHPSETNSSHMLKGFLDFICSNKQSAISLRKRVNLFIVPMINPDGVIMGNSRSNATGNDLNRVYPFASKELYPEIFEFKNLIEKFNQKKEIFLFYDFHGHSGRKNTFFFGPSYPINHPSYYKARMLPKIIESLDNSFRYHACSFTISEKKKTTGRACMFEQYNIPFTYTIQSSIGLYYQSENMKTLRFDQKVWQKMGESICEGTSMFLSSYQQYEQFLSQRRKQREKNNVTIVRVNQTRKGKFFDEEQISDKSEEKNNMKIQDQNIKQRAFLRMFREIKQAESKPKKNSNIEEDISSDDHNQKEDLEQEKIKELNSLVNKCYQVCSLFKDTIKHKRFNSFSHDSQKIQKMKKKSFEEQETILFQEMMTTRKTKSSYGCRRDISHNQIVVSENRKPLLTTRQECQPAKPQTKNNNKIHFPVQRKQKIRRGSLVEEKQEKKLKKVTISQSEEIDFGDNNNQNFKTIVNTRQRFVSRHSYKQTNTQSKTSKILQPNITTIQQPQTKTLDFKLSQFMQGIQKRSNGIKHSVKFIESKKMIEKSQFLFSNSFMGSKCSIGVKQVKSRIKERGWFNKNKTKNLESLQFDVKPCYSTKK